MKVIYKVYSVVVCFTMSIMVTYSIVESIASSNKSKDDCSDYVTAKLEISKDYRYE